MQQVRSLETNRSKRGELVTLKCLSIYLFNYFSQGCSVEKLL